MPLDFDAMRRSYEARIKVLEQEVLNCIKVLNKMHKNRSADNQNFINYVQTDTHLLWKFDMHEFSVKNIKLEVLPKNRCVKLYGYRKYKDQLVEVFRTFQLPEQVDIDLSAKLSVNGVLTIQAPLRNAAVQDGDI